MKARKHISALLITLLTASAMSGMAAPVYADETPSLSYDGYTEVWAEEFDGNELNRNDWNVELHNPGWVNSELQAYVDSEDNIRVEDGMLYLIPREETEEMDAGANLLKNADFSNGMNSWTETIANWDNPPLAEASSSTEAGAIRYDISNPGTEDWHVQLKQNNVPLEKGQTYTLQFKAKSDMERTIRVVMQGQENRGWAVYSSDNLVTLGSEFQTFTDKFTMNEDTDLNAFLSICLGNVDEQITTQHRVVIDDISLTMEEAPTPTPTPAPTYKFSDVQNPKHAYFNAIYWAADQGITKGYPDGTFGIDKPCTRGEMMMFLWRYAGKPAPKTVAKSPFKDVSKTHTFYKAILWGAQKKVTTGYTSGAKKGTFGINENCTRGQIVTFLYRAK